MWLPNWCHKIGYTQQKKTGKPPALSMGTDLCLLSTNYNINVCEMQKKQVDKSDIKTQILSFGFE